MVSWFAPPSAATHACHHWRNIRIIPMGETLHASTGAGSLDAPETGRRGVDASEFDAVVDLDVLGDEPRTLVDRELFFGTIGIDPEAGPTVALVLRGLKRV
jgi:hypothetical protein